MAMTRVGLRDSNKSLPADIRTAFEPQTYFQGLQRLNNNADTVQSSRRWGGINGLGCSVDDDFTGCDYSSSDPSVNPYYTPDAGNSSWLQDSTPILGAGLQTTAPALVIPPTSNGGVDAAAIAKIISAGASSLVPIIAATSQGVLYRVDPKTGAMTVYSQPAGSTVNLPVGGPIGMVSTPFGTATASGFGGSSLVMVAVVGLLALMAFRK